jgi:hypothetical protein
MSTFQRHAWRSSLAIGLAAALLTACGGSGGDSSAAVASDSDCSAASPASCGSLLLGVTDADGDFVSYSVDVQSIVLKRANGATVEMLPATTRLDFAQLTNLADLVSVATLAPGDFVSGSIRLDYSNAEVFVESGGQLLQAKVVGEDGQPLGSTELEIQLDNRNHLVLTRGRAAFLSLDFDLAASNTVDLGQSPPIVTARPFIVAEVAPVEQKDLRLRGTLTAVDAAASSYAVDLRPWHLAHGNHGHVTVHTTSSTSFEINGIASTGSAGLAALAALPAGTLTLAFGALDTTSHSFTASIVQAGDSVDGERLDAVQGSVVARSGDQLTVMGAFAVPHDGEHAASFRRAVLVDVGAGTKVLKVGAPTALTANAISVGQNVLAFGTLTEPSTAGALPTLDATAGRVRLLVTELRGTVNGTVAGQLNLDLRSIDRLDATLFHFSGTGSAPAVDADPADYEIATGSLGLASLGTGEAAKVLGFVTPFGAGPPDFDGRTVIDRRDLPSALTIGWGSTGTAAPFLSMSASGLVIDLANPSIGDRPTLGVGMRLVSLLDLPSSPTIAGAADGAVFGLWQHGHVELFSDFAAFDTALAARLAAGGKTTALAASGHYDEGANVLTAQRIAVYLAAD